MNGLVVRSGQFFAQLYSSLILHPDLYQTAFCKIRKRLMQLRALPAFATVYSKDMPMCDERVNRRVVFVKFQSGVQ